MDNSNILAVNIPNLITVTLMALVGGMIVNIAVNMVRGRKPSGDSNTNVAG